MVDAASIGRSHSTSRRGRSLNQIRGHHSPYHTRRSSRRHRRSCSLRASSKRTSSISVPHPTRIISGCVKKRGRRRKQGRKGQSDDQPQTGSNTVQQQLSSWDPAPESPGNDASMGILFHQGENSNGPTWIQPDGVKGLKSRICEKGKAKMTDEIDLAEIKKRAEAAGDLESKEDQPTSGATQCGICFSESRERGKLDCCDHHFCFHCILEWSKVESRCPMCKQRFMTIFRSRHPDQPISRSRTVHVPVRDQVYEPSDEEVRVMSDPYADIVCAECQEIGDEGLLLLCDFCDSASHTYCVGLGLTVPRGDWFCKSCRDNYTQAS